VDHHCISLLVSQNGFDEDELELLKSKEKLLPKNEIDSMIKAKLKVWKEMKQSGLLSKVSSSTVFEEDVQEVEQIMQKKLTVLKPSMAINNEDAAIKEQSRALFLLKRKYQFAKNNPIEIMNIYNLMKSRQIFNVELFENILMTISRFDSEKNALLAFEDYYGWNKVGDVIATDKFFLRFALNCYANGLFETARHVEKILITDNIANKEDFQSGHVCAAIQQSQTTTVKDFTLKMKPCREELAKFHENIRYHAIENINLVIRSLAKFRMTEEIFDLFDCLRANRVKTNSESLEFLANAIVATIDAGEKADTMKDLPKSSLKIPEIVFVGRSNVGKSSLVNCLFNRKALASTSATPGHTKHFHFFVANRDRTDVPPFCFVDVPGLGYAETVDENKQVSWKSLLQRYLSKRESLKLVCHLIDARHKVTQNDKEMFEIAIRSAAERKTGGESLFQYAIILTKADKVTKKVLQDTIRDVEKYTQSVLQSIETGSGVVDASILTIPPPSAADSDSVDRKDEDDVEEIVVRSESSKSKSKGTRKALAGKAPSGQGDIEVIATSTLSEEGMDRVWRMLQTVIRKSHKK